MELSFITVDVFTRTRFRGNPLAVVTIPKGTVLTYEQKLSVAREFNLSETVFVHEPAAPSSTRDIDIFLTTREIPFAGHPTIGAAVTLLPQGVTMLIAKAGPIEIIPIENDAAKAAIPHETHLHAKTLGDIGTGAWLSPNSVVRALEHRAPVFSIVRGMTFVLIELPDLGTLATVAPAMEHVPDEICDEGWKGGFVSKYFFVKTGPNTVRTRMMEPAFEDPATGSAACALASYLALHGGSKLADDGTAKFEITQGVEMGKESNILVEIGVNSGKLKTVSLAGAAVPVMRGTITV